MSGWRKNRTGTTSEEIDMTVESKHTNMDHLKSGIPLEAKVSMVVDQLGVPESAIPPAYRKTSLARTASIWVRTTRGMFQASASSKMGMKMFRSHRALEEEQKRQEATNTFIIHPFSAFRWYWDMFIVVLLIATLVLLPVNIAFFSDEFNLEWVVLNCITDTVFMIDILLNFFTGVVHHQNEEVILTRRAVMCSYLRGWFILDLLSSFPFDYLYIGFRGDSDYNQTALTLRTLRLAKVISLLRLLRLSRLLRYVHRLEEVLQVESAVIRILNLVLVILMLTHWNGCIQFLIPFLMEFPADSWIVRDSLVNATKWEQYSWCFFKAISQTLSIGFGKYPPDNIAEMWATTISMMVGATFYALFIGHMSTLLLSIDASGRLYNERINQVKEYMRYRKLPIETQRRILVYYENRYQRHYFDEDSILEEQNHPLRKEIIQMNCKQLVGKVEFLSQAPSDFTYDVTRKLHFEVYLPEDYIIRTGGRGDRMYFIEHGMVDVIVDGEVVTQLMDGDHFGEIAMLSDARRVASVVAIATSYVYYLKRNDFKSVLVDYPEMRTKIEAVAKERLKKIGKLAKTPEEEDNDADDNASTRSVCGSIGPQSQRIGEMSCSVGENGEDIESVNETRDGQCLPPIIIRGPGQPSQVDPDPVIEVTPPVDN